MATDQLLISGENLAAGSSVTVTDGGVEKVNGALSASVTDGSGDAAIVSGIIQWEVTSDPATATAHSVSITVNSGSITVGEAYFNSSDTTAHRLIHRTNILINGNPPTYPASAPLPTGTADDPTWIGWQFRLNAGDVMTCVLTVDGDYSAE